MFEMEDMFDIDEMFEMEEMVETVDNLLNLDRPDNLKTKEIIAQFTYSEIYCRVGYTPVKVIAYIAHNLEFNSFHA